MASAADRTMPPPPPSLAAGAVVALAAFAFAHGERFVDNLARHHWEDDAFFRHDAAAVHSLGDAFTRPGLWPGLYRPLTTNLYYHLGGLLFGPRVEPYHCVSAALVVGNAVLLFALARRLVGRWALVAAALFASRAAQVEVVDNTCEFQVLAAAACSLASAVLFARALRADPGGRAPAFAASLLAFATSLLCKEPAVALPAVLFGYAWLFDDRRRAPRAVAPYAAVALAWGALFATALRGVSGHRPTGFAYRPTAANVLGSYAAHLLDFFDPLVEPIDDAAMPRRLVALASSGAVRVAVAALAVAALALFAARDRAPARWRPAVATGLFGAWFFLAATAPYAAFEDRLYMRYSYFGHAGLALCAAALAHALWTAARRPPAAPAPTPAPVASAAGARRGRNYRPRR